MLDLAAGDSLGVVAKRYSVPKATVQRWADIVKERMGKTPAVVRENDFDAKIRDGANKLIDTIMAHLDFIADRTWFLNMTAKDGGVDNVNKIRQSTGDQFIAIVRFAQRPAAEPPPSLPEIVDDESWSA